MRHVSLDNLPNVDWYFLAKRDSRKEIAGLTASVESEGAVPRANLPNDLNFP